MLRHACRAISIKPPNSTLAQITGQNLQMPDRTFDFRLSTLLLRERHRCSYLDLLPSHVLLGTSDAINDETGMTRCLAMKSMHFIDRCSSRCCIAPFIGSDWSDTRYCCYVVYRIKNDCAYVNIDTILTGITRRSNCHAVNKTKNKTQLLHSFIIIWILQQCCLQLL